MVLLFLMDFRLCKAIIVTDHVPSSRGAWHTGEIGFPANAGHMLV
jgi:hypothetical protein